MINNTVEDVSDVLMETDNYTIRKGGKIFDCYVSLSNQMSNVDMQKLHDNAEVKMKELSLKDNEYYDYYNEEQKTFIRITGQNNYTDINKFAKVFPKKELT